MLPMCNPMVSGLSVEHREAALLASGARACIGPSPASSPMRAALGAARSDFLRLRGLPYPCRRVPRGDRPRRLPRRMDRFRGGICRKPHVCDQRADCVRLPRLRAAREAPVAILTGPPEQVFRWSAQVRRIDFPLLDTSEVNRRRHLGPDQFFGDPVPRARRFIAARKFPHALRVDG